MFMHDINALILDASINIIAAAPKAAAVGWFGQIWN